jgi:hypothetical protein
MPTLELFATIFPPGVVNVISGSGRVTMPPMMKTAKVDVFAFIGINSTKFLNEFSKFFFSIIQNRRHLQSFRSNSIITPSSSQTPSLFGIRSQKSRHRARR